MLFPNVITCVQKNDSYKSCWHGVWYVINIVNHAVREAFFAVSHAFLRTVNVKVNGLEKFAVIVTAGLTTDALKDRIAEHMGDAAPATDAMKLKLGRKLLGTGTLGDAGVKDGALLTLVTS